MKKIILFVVLFCVFGFNVNAQTFEFNVNEKDNLYNEIYEIYVNDDLENNIPDDVKSLLDSLEIENTNPISINNLLSKQGLDNIKNYFSNKIKLPIKSLSLLITTIIICAFCSAFSSNNLGAKKSLNYICVASVVLIFIYQITSLINSTITIVNTLNTIMLSFIPIFAGILIAALKSGVSVSFSSTMFFVCETISAVSSKVILPFSNCFIALSVAGCLSPTSRISGITRMIKKAAYIILSFLMAIFLAFLSVQSTISNSVDNTMTKTAKFFISSFVPIIGPTLSETLGSFRSCISLLKSTISIYVVIVIILVVLPKIIEIIMFKFVFTLCSEISDMYDIVQIKMILDAFNQALSLILAVVLCVCLMFVFSITIISIAGNSL